MATPENASRETAAKQPEAAAQETPLSEEELGNVSGGIISTVKTTTTSGPLTTTLPTTWDPTL